MFLLRALVASSLFTAAVSSASAFDPPIPHPPGERPDLPMIHVTEPGGPTIYEPPDRITVFFQRYAAGIVPQSVELWIDGVEYTESLRFWVDRAWVDLPRAERWRPGTHTVEALVRTVTGGTHRDFKTVDLIPPPFEYAWPFGEQDPSAIANLMEDYQDFSGTPYWHKGLDIRADAGATVHATVGGHVAFFGNYRDHPAYYNITILGDDDLLWQFSHVTEESIAEHDFEIGDRVEAGDPLGRIYDWIGGDAQYDHLHMNSVALEGLDVDAWHDAPFAVPAPLSEDEGWLWHNPLRFLADTFDVDTITPECDGERYPDAPDVFFLENESIEAFASSDDEEIVLSGDVDIVVHLMDTRDDVPEVPGDPYTLGLFEVAWQVEPLGPQCANGWVPYTRLRRFDTIPGGFNLGLQALYLLDIHQENIEHESTYETKFNWSFRDLFYNVTNTSLGVPNSEHGFWDTDMQTQNGPMFSDGPYRVTVYAKDFDGNTLAKSVELDLDNDILSFPNCADDIAWLDPQGMNLVAPTGQRVAAHPPAFPIAFDSIDEGAALTTIPAEDWPAWSFEICEAGLVVAIGVLDAQQVEVEYVPYLGDVILEIPAEVQYLPWDCEGPAPAFDPSAPPTNPVDLRLSTRLARDDMTGETFLGTPHGYGEVEFDLVMAEPIGIPGAGEWSLRAIETERSRWELRPPCPGDIDGDGMVGFGDLLALLAAWGPCAGCPEDLDDDDEVGFPDLLLLLAAWGSCR